VAAIPLALYTLLSLDTWRSSRSLARDQRAMAENETANPKDRGLALATLVAVEQGRLAKIRLRGIDGTGLHLGSVTLDSAVLTGANLDSADLDSARLVGARLDNASLQSASLMTADLRGVNFTGSDLANADLRGSDLSDAMLRGTLLGAANLSAAKLRRARLVDADIGGARVNDSTVVDSADFRGTAWWTASGWSDRHIEELSARYPPVAFVQSPRYGGRIGTDGVEITLLKLRRDALRDSIRARRARGDTTQIVDGLTPALAVLYNNRAWFRATHGSGPDELALALADADSALKLLPYDAAMLDTRAYVLIRIIWDDHSRPLDRRRGDALKNLVEAVRSSGDENTVAIGERYYHLGLAYEALKDSVPAVAAFRRAAAAGYGPSYERVLTPSRWAAIGYAAAASAARPRPSKRL
jgi:uncharacterized protein YjbI with pentapeptide repeats